MNQKAAQSIKKIGGADFLVRIVFRQNASWQGEVHLLNTGQRRRFRSFLELTVLMNQFMEEHGYPRGDQPFQVWDRDSPGKDGREGKALQS